MSRARTTFYSLGVGELDPENDYDDPQVRADIDRTFDLFCRNLVSARAASVAVLSVWSGYEIRMTGGLIFRKSETAKQQSAAAKSESETAGVRLSTKDQAFVVGDHSPLPLSGSSNRAAGLTHG